MTILISVAPAFEDVQRRVYGLIKNKVLVGHSLWVFLSVRSSRMARRRPEFNKHLIGTWTQASNHTHSRPCPIPPSTAKAKDLKGCGFIFARPSFHGAQRWARLRRPGKRTMHLHNCLLTLEDFRSLKWRAQLSTSSAPVKKSSRM